MTFFVFVIKISFVVLNTSTKIMQTKWTKYENFRSTLHKKFGLRMLKKHNKGRRIDKTFNFSNKVNQKMIYLGEIMIVAVFSFCTWIFGNGDLTPNNMKLVYPLQEVAKLECR